MEATSIQESTGQELRGSPTQHPCVIGKKEKEQEKGKSKVKREPYKELCAVCKERKRGRESKEETG